MKRTSVLAPLLILLVGFLGYAHAPGKPLPEDAKADRVLVEKSARRLTLLREGRPLKTYAVSLGGAPVGPKRREGDERTPEGVYTLDARKDDSRFHLAFHVSYPDPAAVARARAGGFSPGGAIMIHGMRNGFGWVGRWHRLVDWTDGCIALTDREIDELKRAVRVGTPIEIRP